MSNLITRAITGGLFVAVMITALVLGSYYTSILFALFTVLGLIEFYKLFQSSEEFSPLLIYGTAAGFIIFAVLQLYFYVDYPFYFTVVLIPVALIPFVIELYINKKNPIVNVAILTFGWIYIVFPFYIVSLIRNFNTDLNWKLIIGMFVLIWSNDTFAYLTGRFFGKNKLFERISPKKTWEGTIGGFAFTLLAGSLFSLFTNGDTFFWIISALIISPCSIFGDLFQSLMKRHAGVKDSGNILPGHGGILDRFDAALFTAPFFFTWIIFYFS